MSLTPIQRNLLSEKLKPDPRIIAAYLMGSVLKAHFRIDSDIDLAILPAPDKEISLMARLELAAELSAILDHPVDIGLLDTQDLIYAKEAAIDLAMHLVAEGRLRMPKNSGDAFTLIRKAGIIPQALEKHLRAMTGFLNVAIHEYRELDKAILHVIARDGWKDLVQFCKALGLRIEP